MKRFLCVFICFLLLAGCEKNSKEVKSEFPDFYGFKTEVKTTVNDVNVSAIAEYVEHSGLALTFTSPESVKGMKMSIKDGECEITMQSLSFVVPIQSMPYDSLCVSLNSCVENIRTAKYENGCYTYSKDGNTYHLYVDDKTKVISKIAVNEKEVVTFSNFCFSQGD